MEDQVAPSDRAVDALVTAQITLDELDVARVHEVLAMPGREVVQDPDPVAALHQRIDKIGPDESGAARDKHRCARCHSVTLVS